MERDVEAYLKTAIGDKRVITLVFHGGNRPGAARDVFPYGINHRHEWGAQLDCICLETMNDIGLRLAAIEIPTDGRRLWHYSDVEPVEWLGEDGPAADAARMMKWPEHVPDDIARDTLSFNQLSELWIASYRDQLLVVGLDIDLDADAKRIMAFELLKNGKRRRHPILALEWHDSMVMNIGGHHGYDLLRCAVPLTRQWSVSEIGNFRSMTRAFELFSQRTAQLLADYRA